MPDLHCIADFGNAYAGLATVGYTVRDSAGSVVTARTTSGVYEIGGGKYGAIVTFTASFEGSIYWDTASGSAFNAVDDIYLAVDAPFVTPLVEDYAALGAAASVAQLLYQILAALTNFAIVGSLKTDRKLNGDPAASYRLDSDTAPTSSVRES